METYAARLVINRADAETGSATAPRFAARWVDPDGQISRSFPFKPPLTAEDTADLRWYLEKYHEFVGAGTRARAHTVEAKLDSWGHALFDAAFGTVEGTHIYRNVIKAARVRMRFALKQEPTRSLAFPGARDPANGAQPNI